MAVENNIIETIIPLLAIILPFIGLFVGKKFERKEKKDTDIQDRFNQIDERLDMHDLKLERIFGRLNGR